MKLVIVESPTKAKTIGKFLGKDYVIKASMGHVMDLPKSKLGIDIEHDFKPQYELNEDKKSTITELNKLSKEATEIILATDPDREGEAISAHIQELLMTNGKLQMVDGTGKKVKSKNHSPSAISHAPFVRIVFHEITKEAINAALKNPGKVNQSLVNAQVARRILDRLVGYKLSPILWQKIRRGLSAGRVQSVALRLIAEREREIKDFSKNEYFTINAILSSSAKVLPRHPELDSGSSNEREKIPGQARNDGFGVDFELIEINNTKIELQETLQLYNGKYTFSKTTITSEEEAERIKKDLENKKFIVSNILEKETKRSPAAPFTTSTLQQDAARRFGFSGKRTMSLAQKLYEEGYITYHRTDSVNLATTAISQIRDYIEKEFGKKYIPEKPRIYVTRQKLAQEAHEAIRPTKMTTTLLEITEKLGSSNAKLYELIFKRAVACQMSDAVIESTTVFVDAEIYRFKTTGSVLIFDGFLKVNPFGLQDKNLPKFVVKQQLDLISILAEKHETSAPPRYNDASLIKSLEEEGIGRPSTYASIISVLEERNYIEREQSKFIPTSIGLTVNDFLVKNFSNIDDIPFTAAMESNLDAIANEGKDWIPMIRDFYTPFEKKLLSVKTTERVQIPVEETGEICPKDNAPLVIRTGKFGKFVSCKNFPTCDFKKQFIETTSFLCPKDSGKIIVKKTKKGRKFYGCSNYPKCDFAVWKLSDLKKQNDSLVV